MIKCKIAVDCKGVQCALEQTAEILPERKGVPMLTDLKTAKRVTGAKQVTRALKSGSAQRVFLAENADPRITEPVADLCREQGVETVSVPTMAALGSACGIAVGSAVAAIVE